MKMLPVVHAHQLLVIADEQRWLIDQLWAEQAVGVIGGEPKSHKSFLALDMAVAVASGTPCLGRFAVRSPGRVLLYAAEDAAATVRERLEGISQAASCTLERLDIQVITVPSLRLDLPADRQKLTATVAHLRPRLLILDPFVRLHRCRENESAEVAPLLAYLRDLQRQFALAVTIVHHARKGADMARAGQALRGSSEFHAWGDSNLYLRRRSERLVLTVEHRAAPALGDSAWPWPQTRAWLSASTTCRLPPSLPRAPHRPCPCPTKSRPRSHRHSGHSASQRSARPAASERPGSTASSTSLAARDASREHPTATNS
jgi:hypothetical protein